MLSYRSVTENSVCSQQIVMQGREPKTNNALINSQAFFNFLSFRGSYTMLYMWKVGGLLASRVQACKDLHTLTYRLNFWGGVKQQEYFDAGTLAGLCKSTG